MTRKITLEWPSEEITIEATLLEDQEPELCDLLWENLEKPLKLFCRHPVSTGEEFSAAARPPRHPVKTGVALGRHKRMFCEIAPGSINYSVHGGYGGLSCYYGPCTEPITVSGAVVGKVVEEDIPLLRKAGKAVWNHYYMIHEPILMTARRSTE
ncbi:MAG: hypothetical protein NWE89_15350 [Candidatus Bathyarchaeota archaeon]|nr:hypothetical protein [Candidatus Bathyarchaeota archaeon]